MARLNNAFAFLLTIIYLIQLLEFDDVREYDLQYVL